MLIGIILALIANYGLGHLKVFEQDSVQAIATIQGFKSKQCKSKDDKKYSCYSRVVSFKKETGEEVIVNDAFTSKRKGKIGDTFELRYLKANPKEYTQRIQNGKTGTWVLLAIGSAIFLSSYWAYQRKVSVFVGDD